MVKLHDAQTVIDLTGRILDNPKKTKRVDIHKELMSTWFTLTDTIIANTKKAKIKKELSLKFQEFMQGLRTKTLQEPQQLQPELSKHLDKEHIIKAECSIDEEFPELKPATIVQEPRNPEEWIIPTKKHTGKKIEFMKKASPSFNRYAALAELSPDLSTDSEIQNIMSHSRSQIESRAHIDFIKAEHFEETYKLQIEQKKCQVQKLQAEAKKFEAQANLDKAKLEVQFLEWQDKKEAILLRRAKRRAQIELEQATKEDRIKNEKKIMQDLFDRLHELKKRSIADADGRFQTDQLIKFHDHFLKLSQRWAENKAIDQLEDDISSAYCDLWRLEQHLCQLPTEPIKPKVELELPQSD